MNINEVEVALTMALGMDRLPHATEVMIETDHGWVPINHLRSAQDPNDGRWLVLISSLEAPSD